MNLVREFRQAERLKPLLERLRSLVTQKWVIMDVCGGQTHAFLRYGLEAAVDDILELIHGPGCPVCVTPAEVIDAAVSLTLQEGVILATFGDLLRVPGSAGSLMQARTQGADVRMVYSPLDVISLARQHPSQPIVFLAVGFETTAPATALAVLQAERLGLTNLTFLTHHVRVEPGMRAILKDPQCRVQGFLAAGHVCTVTGYAHYASLVNQFQVPIVVTGFEPVDLLAGLVACVERLESGRPELYNAYPRVVRPAGNLAALQWLDQVFQNETVPWRGFGPIPEGGLVLQPKFHAWDARQRFGLSVKSSQPEVDCRSAEVLAGQLKPPQCPYFGKECTPDQPRGAPMVSAEGACAAYFRYGLHAEPKT